MLSDALEGVTTSTVHTSLEPLDFHDTRIVSGMIQYVQYPHTFLLIQAEPANWTLEWTPFADRLDIPVLHRLCIPFLPSGTS